MEMQFERIVTTETFHYPQWNSLLANVPPMAMSDDDYHIVPITAKDTERVLDHLRRFFFREEPLNIDIELLAEREDGKCLELEHYCAESIPEGLSMMAVTNSGKVVGVTINGSHEPGHLDEMQSNADGCPNKRFRKILQLLVAVEKGSEVFTKFPDIDRLIEVRILSVDSAMRGRGIAKALLEKTRELAMQLNFPLMRVDCTSHFSARAMASLGFECIFTLKYEDYHQNGEPVFHPAMPHKEVSTYVQRLEP